MDPTNGKVYQGLIKFSSFFFNFDSLVKSRTVINKTGITLVLLKNNAHSEFNSTINCLKFPTRVWKRHVFAQIPILANPDIKFTTIEVVGIQSILFLSDQTTISVKNINCVSF